MYLNLIFVVFLSWSSLRRTCFFVKKWIFSQIKCNIDYVHLGLFKLLFLLPYIYLYNCLEMYSFVYHFNIMNDVKVNVYYKYVLYHLFMFLKLHKNGASREEPSRTIWMGSKEWLFYLKGCQLSSLFQNILFKIRWFDQISLSKIQDRYEGGERKSLGKLVCNFFLKFKQNTETLLA